MLFGRFTRRSAFCEGRPPPCRDVRRNPVTLLDGILPGSLSFFPNPVMLSGGILFLPRAVGRGPRYSRRALSVFWSGVAVPSYVYLMIDKKRKHDIGRILLLERRFNEHVAGPASFNETASEPATFRYTFRVMTSHLEEVNEGSDVKVNFFARRL